MPTQSTVLIKLGRGMYHEVLCREFRVSNLRTAYLQCELETEHQSSAKQQYSHTVGWGGVHSTIYLTVNNAAVGVREIEWKCGVESLTVIAGSLGRLYQVWQSSCCDSSLVWKEPQSNNQSNSW